MKIDPVVFNHWSWFKASIKELKISPSEAWKLDFVELMHLFDHVEVAKQIDTSLMLNFERVTNGASKEWLLQN